jgi:hypothetical protein
MLAFSSPRDSHPFLGDNMSLKQARLIAASKKLWLEGFIRSCKRDENGCLIWQKGKDGRGYGIISTSEGLVKAHRFSYYLHYGAVPDELHVLHKCDVPLCCEPTHLFLGTDLDNVRDMDAKGRRVNVSSGINQNTYKMWCVNGHMFTEANTYICPRGRRLCRACNNERSRVYLAKQKQSAS